MYQQKSYCFWVPKAWQGGLYEYESGNKHSNNKDYVSYHFLKNSKDVLHRHIAYTNFTGYDIWMIERSGLVTYFPSRHDRYSTHHKRPAFIKCTTSKGHKSFIGKNIIDNRKHETTYNNSEFSSIAKAIEHSREYKGFKVTSEYDDEYTIYNILDEEVLLNVSEKAFYWADNDVVLAIDKDGKMIDDIRQILHPYSEVAKQYPDRNDFIMGYEVVDKAMRHNMAFCYIDNKDVVKPLWMPLGKTAIPIPIIKDLKYKDGFYMFNDEISEVGNKFNAASLYTLNEAISKFGIAYTEKDAIDYNEAEKIRVLEKTERDRIQFEREKLDANRSSQKHMEEIEKLKREHAQLKIAHEQDMDIRMREFNEMKLQEDKARQERAMKFDKANSSITLIKELVGFGVAILGIAAIILKARK